MTEIIRDLLISDALKAAKEFGVYKATAFEDLSNAFELANVDKSGIVNFSDEMESSDTVDSYNQNQGDAFTNLIKLEGKDKVFVFYRKGLGDDGPGFEGICTSVLLLHEVGHADDMRKGINFNVKKKTVDLLGAEIYAETFAIRLLDKKSRDKSDLGEVYKLVLGFASSRLLEFQEKGEWYERIYSGIVRIFPESYLKKQAANFKK